MRMISKIFPHENLEIIECFYFAVFLTKTLPNLYFFLVEIFFYNVWFSFIKDIFVGSISDSLINRRNGLLESYGLFHLYSLLSLIIFWPYHLFLFNFWLSCSILVCSWVIVFCGMSFQSFHASFYFQSSLSVVNYCSIYQLELKFHRCC